jgi:hypothetical protein
MNSMITCRTKPSLILVSAPPGSGKTYFASRLEGYVLIDDPKTKPIFEPDVNYVITDPKLCYRKVFDKVNSLYPEAHWVFFNCIGTQAYFAWLNVCKRLEKEPNKVIGYHSFLKFVHEYELNFKYYLESVSSYQIQEIGYGLV